MENITQSIDEIVGQHQTVYDIYFSQADSTDCGIISAVDAVSFLKQSKLNDSILKQIWDLADPTGKGYLDRQSFYITLKLISLAQSNIELKLTNLNVKTPAPKLAELQSNMVSLISQDDHWYIKASQRISYDKVFDSLSPINNKISGTRVKPFLMNSALPVDVLGKIWELSDLDQDGQLSRTEFLISMQLVAKAKEGVTIPDQLPPSLLPFKTRHLSLNAPHPHLPQTSDASNKGWVVSIEEKTKSDILFATLDTDKDGYVTGGELKDIFLKTGLAQPTLAHIWGLCDVNGFGKLNSEQFALAMHFINKKLTTGLEPPQELNVEMIPPSLRPKHQPHEESFVSKDLEELQTQVTELQREKLYYEQRASEHDVITRQKRTELSNLELEMESLFKTLSERELNRSEEQKKLNDCEDKLNKLDQQLVELKRKYESEKVEIENLKFQISNMESSAINKEHDLGKIKSDIQLIRSEKSNFEQKVNNSKQTLNSLNQQLQTFDVESKKNKEKMQILKQIQTNLNKLIKEYGNALASDAKIPSNSDEIKHLEDEVSKLNDQLKNDNFEVKSSPINTIKKSTSSTAIQQPTSTTPLSHTSTSQLSSAFGEAPTSGFNVSNSSANNNNDLFNAFDPFKSDDPFTKLQQQQPVATAAAASKPFDDPFSNAFDPFNTSSAGNVDPFEAAADSATSKRKPPPPRPAPPRPQTPSLKPNKPAEATTARPQSSIDFISKSKFDVFSDFDPFSPAPTAQNNKSNDWAAFASTNKQNTSNFDPFS